MFTAFRAPARPSAWLRLVRRALLVAGGAALIGLAGCGGMPYDCGGIRGKIIEVNSVGGFLTADDDEIQADPGFGFVEVVVEPDPSNYPRNIGYGDCLVELADARGNTYPRAYQGWYGTTQQYRLYYRVPDGVSGFRFQGVDLGL